MMVSVQEPINRKRVLLSSEGSRDPKRLRNNGNEISDSQTNLTTTIINKPSGSESSSISSDKFTEKMYLTYVKSALDALDIVSIICFISMSLG